MKELKARLQFFRVIPKKGWPEKIGWRPKENIGDEIAF